MVELEDGLDATVSDLDEIFDSDLDKSSKKFWLNVAYDFLDDRLDWREFSTSKKKRMEAIAAADAASSQDPRIYRETIGDADFQYQRDKNSTDYWSMLLALDHTGALANAKDGAEPADFKAFGPGW